MSIEFPPGYDPMGRDPSAVTIRTPLPVDNPDDETPEVPSPDAPTPRELASIPDADAWPAATVEPSPYAVNADGPPAPLDVRPDASDELVIYTSRVPAGPDAEPILLINRDRARRRLVVTGAGNVAGAVQLGHKRPSSRDDLGYPVGVGNFPVELYTWAEVWAWTNTNVAAPGPAIVVLAERDRDEREGRQR